MVKNIARVLVLVTVAALCLLIAPHLDHVAAAEPLRLATNTWPGFGGQYVAGSKGFYKEGGIEVKEIYFSDATSSIAAFMSQKTDLAMATTGDLIQMNLKDPSVKAIMVIDYSNGSDGIIGKITKPQDIKGKTVGREDLLFENVLLYSYLQKGGLGFKDIKIVNLTADAAAAAFSAGKVDVAVTYEPYMTKAAKEGGGSVIFTTKDTNLISDVLVTRQEVIDKRRKDLVALIKAFDKGAKLVNSGNAEAISITAKRLNVSISEAKDQISGVKIFDIDTNKSVAFNSSNSNNLLGNLVLNAKLAFEFKLTPQEVDPKSLLDDSIIKSL